MFKHDPSCLEGPVSAADWWIRSSTSLAEAAELPEASSESPIRFALVARIRREIAAGIYETPEKWEVALQKLWQCLGAE